MEATLSHERDCALCGSPLADDARVCPICAPTTAWTGSAPDERVAGETELDIVDVELETRKVVAVTSGSARSERPREELPPDELWWVRSNR
jgi:RNA polymerase subunit RPABC4/transcription elongation factor Spt4